ncbi:MAG: outer membrane lipoprotein carrier protein LolA [Myxococcales bacterium]|nr:MAG: outer membrane lipoprotein carrier protein LolA [Myxococcales bacterium]
MNRRNFSVAFALSLGLPLVAGSSRAEEPKKAPPTKGPAPAPGPSAGLSADEIVTRVQAFYDKTATFKAGFKQRYYVQAYDKTKDSAGSVIFEKPGKMSWRYTSNGNRVVSDGNVIKIYEKENKQMYEQPLSKTQYPAALSFLTGQGKLKQNFKFSKQDSKQMKFESGYVLEGSPLQPTAAYDKVFFYVDAQTYQVRRVLILDAQGNRNRFDFVTSEANTKSPPGEFSFTPPPGTQVIRP